MSLVISAPPWENTNTDDTKKTRRTAKENNIMDSSSSSLVSSLSPPLQQADKNSNVNEILEQMNKINIKNSGDKLTAFRPIQNPILQNKKEMYNNENNNRGLNDNGVERDILNGNINNLGVIKGENLGEKYSNYSNTYKNKLTNIEGFHNLGGSGGGSAADMKELMDKINYAIYLLEEQQNEKTEYVTEEFILYGFVGIFVIFVVDSFNKTTKYIR